MDGQKDGQTPVDEVTWQFRPGETISPRSEQSPTPVPAPPSPEPPTPQVAPAQPPVVQAAAPAQQPVVAMQAAAPEQQPVPETPQPASTPTEVSQPNYPQYGPDNSITWQASEFIDHNKTAGWHALLVSASVVLAVIVWLLTKDIISAIVVILAGGTLSFYGARRPHQLQYQLDDHGLSIGQRHFLFSDFRAFSVIPEGAFESIALIPSKRFAPLTSLYFDPADGDKIVGILGSHLPHQERRVDAVDALMRRIRF